MSKEKIRELGTQLEDKSYEVKTQMFDYKDRIEKAKEYIKEREEDNTTCSVCSVICGDLINILNGDDK